MKSRLVWLGFMGVLAGGQLAVAAEEATNEVDGKTVIVQSGSGGFGGDFQPTQTMHIVLRPGKMEKGAALGVTVSPVTAALRTQLNLPPEVGLVVESVAKNSSAEAAGIEQYDVLEQFNDQILVNLQQFGVLIHLRKPGEEVTLKVLHKGKEISLKAKLEETEMMQMDSNGDFVGALNLTSDRVEGTMKEAMNAFNNAIRPHPPGAGQAWIKSSDKEMTLQMTQEDGKWHLLAKDMQGKVLFDGPINTEEQRKGVPAAVAMRLKQMMEPAQLYFPQTTRPKSDE